MRRTAIALTLFAGFLVAAWGALVLLDLLARSEERTVRPLSVAGDLRLETSSGDVEIVATSGPARLELRSLKGLFGGPGTRVSRGGDGVLSVRTNCVGPFAFSCSGSLRVFVPPATRVAVDTGSGEVMVRGIRGGLVADTGSGDVRLIGVSGSQVTVDTGSGEIEASGLAPGRLRAETGSGGVRLNLLRPPDDVFVDTGSGEVALVLPDVPYDVTTDTGSGNEQIDVEVDRDSPRAVRLQTGSGDISARPPG